MALDSEQYSRVSRRMWRDEKFRKLSPILPSAQGLWLYILSSPRCTPLPGLIAVGPMGLAEDLGWTVDQARGFLDELQAAALVRYDPEARLLWLPNAVLHNPPANPNTVLGWGQFWRLLPECELRNEAAEYVREILAKMDATLGEGGTSKGGGHLAVAFDVALGKQQLSATKIKAGRPPNSTKKNRFTNRSKNGSRNRLENQEQEQEQEQDQDLRSEIPLSPPAGETAQGDPSGGTSRAGDDPGPTPAPSAPIRLTPREQAVAAAIADDRTLGPIAADAPALAVKLCERFPGVDLVAEIGKAGGWSRANPSKAPTKSADRFLAKWLKDKDPTVAWVVACYLAALRRWARIDRAALDGDHKAAAKVAKEASIQVAHRAARGGGGYVPTIRDAAAHWLKTYVTLDDPRLAEQGYPLAFMLTRINVGDLPTRPVTAETSGSTSALPVQRTAPPADNAPPEPVATPEQIQQLGLGAGFGSGGFGNGLTSGAAPILQRPRFS